LTRAIILDETRLLKEPEKEILSRPSRISLSEPRNLVEPNAGTVHLRHEVRVEADGVKHTQAY
jgi:hypothetical protein